MSLNSSALRSVAWKRYSTVGGKKKRKKCIKTPPQTQRIKQNQVHSFQLDIPSDGGFLQLRVGPDIDLC